MFYDLTFEKGDEAIAEILPKGKESDKKNPKMIYYKKMDKESDKFNKEFKIKNDDKLKPLMMLHDGGFPNRVFIAGGTLSGKSYIASKLAEDYHEQFPKNKVILFSWVEDDKNYKDIAKLKCFHKIRIDESILDNPITLNELHDSLCIFDDIEHFSDKYIREELERLRDSAINAGRHCNIAVIVCRQNLLDGPKTKTCLNSSFQVISFPHSGTRFQLGEYLKRHEHMDSKKIQKILNLPSRWILLNRPSPPFVLHEKGCFMLE